MTQTRSAILGALIVVLLALAPAAGRPRHWRTQVAILLAGLAVVGVPAAFASGVAKRVEAARNGTDNSTSGHVSGFWSGVNTIERNPLGLGLNRRVFMEYPIRRLAHRPVRHDTTAAAVDERLSRGGEAGDQCLDGAVVAAVRRVDDTIRCPSFGLQQRGVVERTDNWIDAVVCDCVGLGAVTNEAANYVTIRDQSGGDCAAYETVRASEEDAHLCAFRVVID